jgi:hypothetical protein
MSKPLPRKGVPRDFCERFCAAWRADRCLCMTRGVCGWTAERAVAVMDKNSGKLNQSLYVWMRKLR